MNAVPASPYAAGGYPQLRPYASDRSRAEASLHTRAVALSKLGDDITDGKLRGPRTAERPGELAMAEALAELRARAPPRVPCAASAPSGKPAARVAALQAAAAADKRRELERRLTAERVEAEQLRCTVALLDSAQSETLAELQTAVRGREAVEAEVEALRVRLAELETAAATSADRQVGRQKERDRLAAELAAERFAHGQLQVRARALELELREARRSEKAHAADVADLEVRFGDLKMHFMKLERSQTGVEATRETYAQLLQAERLSSVQLMERLARVEEACDERSQPY